MFRRAMLCTAAILFAAGVGMAAPRNASTSSKSWAGWITGSKCGAKGANAAHAECLKKCIAAGAKYVLYDTYNKKLYQIDPQASVADHGAQHVRVYGTLDGDTIHVTSVKMLATQKTKAATKPAS